MTDYRMVGGHFDGQMLSATGFTGPVRERVELYVPEQLSGLPFLSGGEPFDVKREAYTLRTFADRGSDSRVEFFAPEDWSYQRVLEHLLAKHLPTDQPNATPCLDALYEASNVAAQEFRGHDFFPAFEVGLRRYLTLRGLTREADKLKPRQGRAA